MRCNAVPEYQSSRFLLYAKVVVNLGEDFLHSFARVRHWSKILQFREKSLLIVGSMLLELLPRDAIRRPKNVEDICPRNSFNEGLKAQRKAKSLGKEDR